MVVISAGRKRMITPKQLNMSFFIGRKKCAVKRKTRKKGIFAQNVLRIWALSRKVKIKVIDFEATARVNEEFKDKVGLVDLDRRIVWIDRKLPSFTNGSRELTKRHELAHLLIKDCKLKFTAQVEESLCELIAICTAKRPLSTLSTGEMLFRNYLTENGKLRWNRHDDRLTIIYNIFRALKQEPSDRELDILAGE